MLKLLHDLSVHVKEYESNNQSKKTAELKRQAHKLTRKKVASSLYYWCNQSEIQTTQVSLKFRDPLSAIGVSELLLPLKRLITEHEDINSYVQRAGGLNKAILSVLSEKNLWRYSEGHVSNQYKFTDHTVLLLAIKVTNRDKILQVVAYVSAFLLEGASPSAVDDDGNTPLHLAAKRAFTQCAKELLKWGADANKENENLETPLELSLTVGLSLKDNERMSDFSKFAAMIAHEMRPAKYVL